MGFAQDGASKRTAPRNWQVPLLRQITQRGQHLCYNCVRYLDSSMGRSLVSPGSISKNHGQAIEYLVVVVDVCKVVTAVCGIE
jgi:hypothetical protein